MSAILPHCLSKWFSIRKGVVPTLMIMSNADYKRRQALQTQLPRLVCGITIIVKEDTYRIVKFENKNFKRYQGTKDFDITGSQLERYDYLVELLPHIVRSYEVLTGVKVSRDSYNPLHYLSLHTPTTGVNMNQYLFLQQHQYPYYCDAQHEYGTKFWVGCSFDTPGTYY